ncbi:unnamed protein product [Lota lota]
MMRKIEPAVCAIPWNRAGPSVHWHRRERFEESCRGCTALRRARRPLPSPPPRVGALLRVLPPSPRCAPSAGHAFAPSLQAFLVLPPRLPHSFCCAPPPCCRALVRPPGPPFAGFLPPASRGLPRLPLLPVDPVPDTPPPIQCGCFSATSHLLFRHCPPFPPNRGQQW